MHKKFIPAYLLTFVNMLGFGILLPVLPFIVDSYNAPKWVYGLLLTLYSAFQFIGAPYLGAMSDYRGRKPILMVSQAGTLFSWLVFLFALYLPTTPLLGIALPLWIIGLSRILDGITGGNNSVTQAYVGDITNKKEKTFIFGYLGGVAGIAMVIAPGLGGFTAGSSLGYVGTLLTAIAVSVITLLAIFYWVKESHPPQNRGPTKKQSLFKNIFIFKKIKEVNPKPIIKLIFCNSIFL